MWRNGKITLNVGPLTPGEYIFFGDFHKKTALGTLIAKSIKVTLIKGPLRWIDSTAGAIFEVSKYVILFYIIGTILLWAPWSAGQNSVAASKVYLQIDSHAPGAISALRNEIEKLLANPRPD
mgnify:CR=1 FL=1